MKKTIKISRTVHPDQRLPFNDWIHYVITRREQIQHLSCERLKGYKLADLNQETKRYYGKNR